MLRSEAEIADCADVSQVDLTSTDPYAGHEFQDDEYFRREENSRRGTNRRTTPLERMQRFYRSAKRVAWDINDLPWDEQPPVPRYESERWRLLWSSVVQQQLQADRTAVEAATKLLLEVPEVEAKMYYSTMVQDEARHIEGWTRLASTLEPVDGFSPYFAELSERFLECDMLEESVLLFQVLFEGCALEAFREIAKTTQSTVLGAMASKLIVDDAIHHRSGVTYEEHLLANGSKALRSHLSDVLKTYMPLYIENLTWRPRVRNWLSGQMKDRDQFVIHRNQVLMSRAVTELGLAAPFDL